MIVHAGLAFTGTEVIRDYAVYVQDGVIVDTGSRQDLSHKYPEANLAGGADLIMLPGFVNAHDHGRAIGTQSLGVPDSFLEVWLASLGGLPTLPPELAGAWEGLQLVKSGVTSTAHSHNPATWESQFEELPQTLRGYRQAGVRVALHPVIIDQNTLVYMEAGAFRASLPPALRGQIATRDAPPDVDDYFRGLTELYAAHHDPVTHRVHIQASPAGGQWCSDALTLRAVAWARQHATRVQMHMLETRYQRAYAFKTWGKSFVQHLHEIGVLGDWLTLAHMVWVEDDDFPLLERVGIVHNPGSNLRLRSGVAPFFRFKQAGVGMDGHTLDDDQDYLREMRLAWTLANRPGMASADVTAAAVLRAGTRQGAQITFGEDVPLGYLGAGALADLVLLDWREINQWVPDAALATQGQLLSLFLRRASRQHVRHVMVHGEWVLWDGQHTRLDEAALAAAIKAVLAAADWPSPDALATYIRQFYAGGQDAPG